MTRSGLVLSRHTDKCCFALGEERGKMQFPRLLLFRRVFFFVKFEMRAESKTEEKLSWGAHWGANIEPASRAQ